MTAIELFNHYGSKVKAAAALGVSENTIRTWLIENNVPMMVQLAAETLTKGKLKADRLQFKNKAAD